MLNTQLPAGLERRREDFDLITGVPGYVDDLKAPENRPAPLVMMVVRSPYPNALIKSIDLAQARNLPGVVVAFSAAELVGAMKNMDAMPVPDLKKPDRRPLAIGQARYVGDPVAVVAAEDRYAALDARDLVAVEYEPLKAVTGPEAALQKGSPLVYPEYGTNQAFSYPSNHGDITAAFKEADRVIRLRVVNQRIAPSSMEPRACMFDYNPKTGEMNGWVSSQAIYRARETIAAFLGIDRSKIRIRNAFVGGGFGSKTAFVGEEIAVAALAYRLGRPVKWLESRSENLQAQTHARGQINYIEAAVKNDGALIGLRVRSLVDLGSWLASSTVLVPTGSLRMLNGPYKLKAIESRMVGVFTNKVPTAAYRGAGRPEAAYILERTIERVAVDLGMDPAEVRLRNFIPPEAFPYNALTGIQYDSGNYGAALQKALELANYAEWRARQKARRESGSTKLLGIGIGTYLEISGGGGAPQPGVPVEAATVRVRRDGTVLVQSGVAHNGQGHFTAFAQVAARTFNLPGNKIEVQMNDTALPAYGIGTFGSRTTPVAASTVLLAAEAARDKALQVAARQLEASFNDLVLEDGRVTVRGVPSAGIELGELARLVEENPALIEQDKPNPVNGAPIEGLAAWRDFSPLGATFPSGAHLALVEVDTDTGNVDVLEYVAVDDAGRILNHYLADAQVHGSLAQGISQALYEEIVYDENGQLVTGTLMDYAIPTAERVPYFVTGAVETPSPVNPLGAKGIAEGGCTGGPPAIVNGVINALAHLGVKALDMPLIPEKIWQAVQAARAGTLDHSDPVIPAFLAGDEGGADKESGDYVFE
jgi:carbon-monoxide dehydrogenase large subunit